MIKTPTDTGSVERLVGAREAQTAGGYPSVPQMYNAIAAGNFVKPIKISERSVRWVESELLKWQRDRIAERDARLAKKSKEKADAQG